MPRLFQVRHHQVCAVMVSEETLEIAAEWCGGKIAGQKLPRRQRVIQFWSKARDQEQEAEWGDYIVEIAPQMFERFPRNLFHAMFIDIDEVSF